MNIRDLYSGNLLDEAFERLQSMRKTDAKSERLVTQVKGPGVLKDDFLRNWLAFNYLFATGFDDKHDVVMGEFGGVMFQHPDNGKLSIGVADASINKVAYGLEQMKNKAGMDRSEVISELETEIDMPVVSRNEVIVVNGNRNVAHYDFTTSVAQSSDYDLIQTNNYLLFAATGFTVVSNKHLPSEHYVFSVPKNDKVLEGMKGKEGDDFEKRLAYLNDKKDILLPEQFVAGFHIVYSGNTVSVSPLISERDSNVPLSEFGVSASESSIGYIGSSSPMGQPLGVFDNFVK